jgi:hypothetical protein
MGLIDFKGGTNAVVVEGKIMEEGEVAEAVEGGGAVGGAVDEAVEGGGAEATLLIGEIFQCHFLVDVRSYSTSRDSATASLRSFSCLKTFKIKESPHF